MSIVPLRCRTHNRGPERRPYACFQIQLDASGKRARRDLTEQNDRVVKGPWQYTARPFAPGIYCVHCLNEGRREPLPIDELDIADLGLGDTPVVFQQNGEFSSQQFVASLQERYGSLVQSVHDLPAQPATYAAEDWARNLHPGVQRALRERLLPAGGRLYGFQATAIDAALAGRDVIVTTPTASGKSLTYTVPIAHTLLGNATATALYISPLVALTEDQLAAVSRLDASGTDWERKGERFSIHRVLRMLDTGAGKFAVARYDGSVSKGDRQDIRENRPRYILTTPDMLHIALLSGAYGPWQYLFANLRYVVIDELHTYRGILGASFANLLRRLQRICTQLGARPQFICASATITEPAHTVEQFIGRVPVVVDATSAGAPQQRRNVVVWNAGTANEQQYALSTQAKNVLLHLVEQRVRGIAFARSISEINDIYRFVDAELRASGIQQPITSPFMRELRSDQKRAIISDLKQGRLHSVISTTALSMGIDIGNLSVAAIIGFPGSIAQFWQQAGRAGRAGEGVVVFIADRNPLDQFLAQHPDVLFDLRAEPVYCNPDNPYIVRGHLLRAAYEAPLSREELAWFGPEAATQAAHLLEEGALEHTDAGLLTVPEQAREQAQMPFRNLTFAINVVTEERAQVVEVDAARAQRALHRHAHYQHINRYYQVVTSRIDWKEQRGDIVVRELERPEYTTTARVEQKVSVVAQGQGAQQGAYSLTAGTVECRTSVTGYYKVPLFTRNEAFTYQPLGIAAPPPLTYETQALWLTLSPRLLDNFTPTEQQAGLYSLAGAIRMATTIEMLCDPSDIECLGFVEHEHTGQPTLMLYDAVPGGVGIAESAVAKMPTILMRARQILHDCPHCSAHPESKGCPYCVTARYGDETTINRHAALKMLDAIVVR